MRWLQKLARLLCECCGALNLTLIHCLGKGVKCVCVNVNWFDQRLKHSTFDFFVRMLIYLRCKQVHCSCGNVGSVHRFINSLYTYSNWLWDENNWKDGSEFWRYPPPILNNCVWRWWLQLCERQIEYCGTVVAGTGKADRADLDWSLWVLTRSHHSWKFPNFGYVLLLKIQ